MYCSQAPNHSIEEILFSQKTLKNINVSIRSTFFGYEWANGPECRVERYKGVIKGIGSKAAKSVKILWEGWDKAKVNTIETLLGDDECDHRKAQPNRGMGITVFGPQVDQTISELG